MNRAAMDPRTSLELELFLFALISQTEKIFRRFELNADEMYVLIYIKHFGKLLGLKRVVLRSELTSVMKTVFDRQDSAISKSLNVLFEEGLLSAYRLAISERVSLYGTAAGRKTVIALTDKGLRKAEAFGKEVDLLLISRMPTESPNLIRETFQKICAETNKGKSLSQQKPRSKRKR